MFQMMIEEKIDTGNVEVELDKEKAKPDELAGKSLRQLAKMLKEMHIKSNKKHNTDKSATKVSLFALTISVCPLSLVIVRAYHCVILYQLCFLSNDVQEHVGKKRIALQALPENCSIAVDEGLKEN